MSTQNNKFQNLPARHLFLEEYKEAPLALEVFPDDKDLSYFAAKPLSLPKCCSQVLLLFLKSLYSWIVALEANLNAQSFRAWTEVALYQFCLRASKFVISKSPHSLNHTAQDPLHMTENLLITVTLALVASEHHFNRALHLVLQGKVMLRNETLGILQPGPIIELL